MVPAVGEKTRAALLWGGLAAAIVVAFAVTVAILNATVYSAGGFARSYLDALDRGDTASALVLAGVRPTGAAGDELLGLSERGRLDDIRETDDRSLADGAHRITLSFRPGGAGGVETTTFPVQRSGTRAGLFHQWEFVVPPTASIEVTPQHDPRFTANGTQVRSKGADLATRYTVLAPSVVELSHESTYLRAADSTVVAAKVGGVVAATVDVEARTSFVDQVRTDVTKYLRTTCLTQKVLLPSGCPFGQQVDDRLASDPKWSMPVFPPVSLSATDSAGVWQVPRASGRAHLKVEAKDLYDGHDYTVDEDVPFDVSYSVTIGADNRLTISPQD